jgi:ElaB/YqjD/DUF883 family membrane-anchored ribosome-binding protein
MDDLKEKLTDTATSLGEDVRGVAGELRTRTKDAWDSAQHQARRAVRESSACVRENPVPAALAAFGLGLVLGLILSRREPASFKDRCIAAPLHQSKGALLGLLVACGALIRRSFSSASTTAGEIAENVSAELKDTLKPLKKAARETGRKLGVHLVLLLAAGLLMLLPPARAHAASDVGGGTFSIYFENDLFTGTDSQYTSGVKLGWSSGDLENYSDSPYASPLLPVFNILPFVNEKAYQKNLAFTLGQNIYTPDDTEAFGPVEGDRPYAGWLYMGVGVVWKNAEVRNSLVLNVGVVGSWSYAEESQRLVHDLRGLGHPNGWNNQLHNELGVVAIYQREWRWPKHERRVGFDWEMLPHAGVALGNVQTYANLGGELRAGFNLPDDFGTAVISPAATTSTPVDGRQGAERARFDLGLYLFARVDGRVVAHNIFLDGNTFGDGPSVDRNWFVADLSVGAAVNFRNTKFAYALVYRTEEFDGQKEGQIFGTVSVNFAF